MATPFAINGLGRIGRAVARISLEQPGLKLVAINDLAPPVTLAHLLARDSVHGSFPASVDAVEGGLRIDGRRVAAFGEPVPRRVPWEKTGARIVLEATGQATGRQVAEGHLGGGVEKVLISAIAEGVDLTLCPGLSSSAYRPGDHHIVSSASCTTHCLALLLKVLEESFGIEEALMNEVHSYTGNQVLVDGAHRDPRRARAAAVNIVPTTTAAPAAVEALMPALAGRVGGQAVRVPTPNVALLDLVALLRRPASVAELNLVFEEAAGGSLAGLLGVTSEPLVSTDFYGDPRSAVVDLGLTKSQGGRLVRLAAWYDNEWGYSHRLVDFLAQMAEGMGPAD